MKKIGLLPKLVIAIIVGILLGNLEIKPVIKLLATFNPGFPITHNEEGGATPKLI